VSSSSQAVRVRFAPSPTGGLHIGGVRTVLYNCLFARRHGGTLVLRVEDTDQGRFVADAEDYIQDCLRWCKLEPDESPAHGGPHAPYRQSERKESYGRYAHQLVESGHAYYAFDTPEELEEMRARLKTDDNPSPQYDARTRGGMRNSLSLSKEEVKALMDAGEAYVVRIKMPEKGGTVSFTDLIRGEVSFDLAGIDDKVLLKRDGMPTYHLAVVVDDYAMEITHAFRGEEWLPSAPVHLLLWEHLGWKDRMPKWAHLPLILGPDGAKLSKRHGSRYGFPIFAMNWTDPRTGDFTEGFRERGFLPEALLNMLALLGWNDGSGEEIFTLDELVQRFDLARVNHSGAVFDYEKARWFNHQHIQRKSGEELAALITPYLEAAGLSADEAYTAQVALLVRDRLHVLSDIIPEAGYFFHAPQTLDLDAVRPKWNEKLSGFFDDFSNRLTKDADASEADLEALFSQTLAAHNLKKGEAMLPLRVMLVGGKFGPGVFAIAALLGAEETTRRIRTAVQQL
jgi:glutamyl-tRNA synthetase